MSSVSALRTCTVPKFHWLPFTKTNRHRSVWVSVCVCVCVCVVGQEMSSMNTSCLTMWPSSRVTHLSSSILGADEFLNDRIRGRHRLSSRAEQKHQENKGHGRTGQNLRAQTARRTNTERPPSKEASGTSSSTPVCFSQLSTFRREKNKEGRVKVPLQGSSAHTEN